MNRGDHREDIFKDDQDRKGFLSTLGEESPVSDLTNFGRSEASPEIGKQPGPGCSRAHLTKVQVLIR